LSREGPDNDARDRPRTKVPVSFSVPLPSVEKRLASGKALRAQVAVGAFAAAYDKQTDRDYDALVKAAEAKRIRVANTA
jgi:hypothetical protein